MEPDPHNRPLQNLCAHLMREPHRLTQAEWVRTPYPIDTEPHLHENILQIDLMLDHQGAWLLPHRRAQLTDVSAAVFYPGDPHGYAMTPSRPDAQFFSFKIRVSPNWKAIEKRTLAESATALTGVEPLLRAARRVVRLHTVAIAQAPLLGVALCEMLCLWPRATGQAPPSSREILATELDQRLESALAMIYARLAAPPTLDEMAAAAHLSPRQFARRFRALCGVSPRDYVAARRLARARELLAQGRLTVTEVSETLGFSSIHAFSRWFRRQTGIAPSEIREHPSLL